MLSLSVMSNMTTEHPNLDEEVDNYPRAFVSILSTVLLMEGIVGLTSNLIVLLVFHLEKRALNQVGNILITNLNLLDVVVCLTALPLTVTLLIRGRTHHAFFCYVHEALMSFSSASTALNILVISYDRFETIVVPFKRKLNMRRVRYVVTAIWSLTLIALICPLLILLLSNSDENLHSGDRLSCYSWVEKTSVYIFFDVYCIVLYLISNTVMVVCYAKIFKAAQNRISVRMAVVKAAIGSFPGPMGPQQEANLQRSREKTVTKVTLMIVFTFMVCWGPHTTVSTVILVTKPSYATEMVHLTCLTLAYSTIALHPLLYAFKRKKFRQAMSQQFRGRLRSLRRATIHPGDVGGIPSPRMAQILEWRGSLPGSVSKKDANRALPAVKFDFGSPRTAFISAKDDSEMQLSRVFIEKKPTEEKRRKSMFEMRDFGIGLIKTNARESLKEHAATLLMGHKYRVAPDVTPAVPLALCETVQIVKLP